MNIGFLASKTDPSLFVLDQHGAKLYTVVYVDDILVTGWNSSLVTAIIDALAKEFNLRDLGEALYFLGVEVCRTKNGILLIQQKYI